MQVRRCRHLINLQRHHPTNCHSDSYMVREAARTLAHTIIRSNLRMAIESRNNNGNPHVALLPSPLMVRPTNTHNRRVTVHRTRSARMEYLYNINSINSPGLRTIMQLRPTNNSPLTIRGLVEYQQETRSCHNTVTSEKRVIRRNMVGCMRQESGQPNYHEVAAQIPVPYRGSTADQGRVAFLKYRESEDGRVMKVGSHGSKID